MPPSLLDFVDQFKSTFQLSNPTFEGALERLFEGVLFSTIGAVVVVLF